MGTQLSPLLSEDYMGWCSVQCLAQHAIHLLQCCTCAAAICMTWTCVHSPPISERGEERTGNKYVSMWAGACTTHVKSPCAQFEFCIYVSLVLLRSAYAWVQCQDPLHMPWCALGLASPQSISSCLGGWRTGRGSYSTVLGDPHIHPQTLTPWTVSMGRSGRYTHDMHTYTHSICIHTWHTYTHHTWHTQHMHTHTQHITHTHIYNQF